MTMEQYTKAESHLIARLQTMGESESGAKALLPKAPGSDGSGNTLDDEYDQPILLEQQEAHNKWMRYCALVKGSRKYPKRFKAEGLLQIEPIKFGTVEEQGEDIEATPPFKKCNLGRFH
jgi:hypothetical protein